MNNETHPDLLGDETPMVEGNDREQRTGQYEDMSERPKQKDCQHEPPYPDHVTEIFLFRYPEKLPVTD